MGTIILHTSQISEWELFYKSMTSKNYLRVFSLLCLKTIEQFQWKDEVIMDKYKIGKYRRGYFCGGSNRYFNLIMCEDKIVIQLTLQRYVLNWYHMHIHNQGEDRTEATICQNLYLPGIR